MDALAPNGFAAAVRAHETARKDRERGRDAKRVSARLQEGEAAIQRAQLSAASARQSLNGVIKTRDDAIAAEAPKHAPDAWAEANERFRQAMAENEAGDVQERAAARR